MRYVGILLALLVGCSDPKEQTTHVDQKQPTNDLPTPWFVDVAASVGVHHQYYSADTGKFYIIETMGGGAALFDYDNDGDLDLYITQGNVLGGAPRKDLVNRLYENNGDGTFVDRTSGSGATDAHYSIGVTTGDYNNDGYVDLYITNYGRNTLLRNNGDRTFTDVTEQAGVGGMAFSACAAFADLDADGDLDLFVTNYLDWTIETEKDCFSEQNHRDYCNPSSYDAPIADTLYINNGDGTFSDASVDSGINGVLGTGLGVAIGPVDQDDLPDIFVANDGMEDRLWINQGDGTFREDALRLGCAVDDTGKKKASMGIQLKDIDNDGDLDLLVTTLFRETDSLYENVDGVFVDTTARWGLAADTRSYTRWGMALVDFNNDGLDDLYEATGRVRWQADLWDEDDWLAEPNLLFTQTKSGRFSLVEPRGGVASPLIRSAHGMASGDIDNDGGIDLVIVNKDASVNVLRNIVENRGNWIMLDVRNKHNAPAIGAKVEVKLQDGSTLTRYICTTYGYASANDPRIHIGLGDAMGVDSVSIRWPSGDTSTYVSLEAQVIHKLKQ